MEVWDIISCGLVVAAVSNDPIGKPLAPYYYACFGLSCAASLLAVSIKIKLVLLKLRKRSKIGKRGNSPSAKALLRIEEQIDEAELQAQEAVCAFLLAIFEARNAPPCFLCRQGLTLFAVPGCSDGRARNSLHPTLGARPELGQDDSIIDTIAPQISDYSRVVSHICHIPRVRDLASAHSSRLVGAEGGVGSSPRRRKKTLEAHGRAAAVE